MKTGHRFNVRADLKNVVVLAGGRFHNLALKSDGTVVGWGMTRLPQQVMNVVGVAAGDDICLVLHPNATVGHWYSAFYGINPGSPPPGLTNVVAISTRGGPGDGLALISDGPLALAAPLANPHHSNGAFSILPQTRNGRIYALEYKNSLTDGNWTALPLVAGTGGLLTLTDPTAAGAQRFYRVREW